MLDVIVMSEDAEVLGAMAEAIESAGFTVLVLRTHGRVNELAAFIRKHEPGVVVYDLGSPPLEESVKRLKALCAQIEARRRCIVTSPYPYTLDLPPCCEECVRLDVDAVTEAVHRALCTDNARGAHVVP